jgi:hypothetical protein
MFQQPENLLFHPVNEQTSQQNENGRQDSLENNQKKHHEVKRLYIQQRRNTFIKKEKHIFTTT